MSATLFYRLKYILAVLLIIGLLEVALILINNRLNKTAKVNPRVNQQTLDCSKPQTFALNTHQSQTSNQCLYIGCGSFF